MHVHVRVHVASPPRRPAPLIPPKLILRSPLVVSCLYFVSASALGAPFLTTALPIRPNLTGRHTHKTSQTFILQRVRLSHYHSYGVRSTPPVRPITPPPRESKTQKSRNLTSDIKPAGPLWATVASWMARWRRRTPAPYHTARGGRVARQEKTSVHYPPRGVVVPM